MKTLKAAIERAGGITKLARELKVSNQAIHGWLNGAYDIRARHVARIAELTHVDAGELCKEIAARHREGT